MNDPAESPQDEVEAAAPVWLIPGVGVAKPGAKATNAAASAKGERLHQENCEWIPIISPLLGLRAALACRAAESTLGEYSYNRNRVAKAGDVPLHPGAARYYRERGYMKERSSSVSTIFARSRRTNPFA